MLTLYHSPQSRSTRIIALLDALGILGEVDVKLVHIPRMSGYGHRDDANPHAEGKVPLLITEEGEEIRESNAIMLYLTDRFGTLGPKVGDKGRGTYLSWMTWYGNVFEPVYVLQVAGLSDDPVCTKTFRAVPEAVAVLNKALEDGRSFLLGEDVTAADMLIASTYQWFPESMENEPLIKAWVGRVAAMPCQGVAFAFDLKAKEALGLPEAA